MADFADGVSDDRAGRRLERAIRGSGAFRRFKDELHEAYPDRVPVWYAFRDARANRRAGHWGSYGCDNPDSAALASLGYRGTPAG